MQPLEPVLVVKLFDGGVMLQRGTLRWYRPKDVEQAKREMGDL